jgi:xanthine/CO dehydrogenase XdhC/CoxF family maturation factor
MRSPEGRIDYAEPALDLFEAAASLIEGSQRCTLVASLAIEGGTAREVGYLAVVGQDGAMTGYLPNGCMLWADSDRCCAMHISTFVHKLDAMTSTKRGFLDA